MQLTFLQIKNTKKKRQRNKQSVQKEINVIFNLLLSHSQEFSAF